MYSKEVACPICGYVEEKVRTFDRRTLADEERDTNLDKISNLLTDQELYKLVDELERKKYGHTEPCNVNRITLAYEERDEDSDRISKLLANRDRAIQDGR